MKAFVLRGSHKAELIETPVPRAQDGDILVKMRVCGICGTDIEKILGEAVTPPVLGHEVTGEVVEVGRGVAGLKAGDRVFVHHHVSCGKCHYCLQHSATMCRLFSETNIEPGGFSEFFRVPKTNIDRGAVLRLPDGLSFEEASFIEPLACCLRSIDRCRVKPSFTVVIVGCGPMGLLMIKCLKVLDVSEILGIDLLDYRLDFARKEGAETIRNQGEDSVTEAVRDATHGMGADLVVVATGNKDAFRQALSLVRRGGTLSVFGAPEKDAEISLRLGRIFYDEISLIPSYSTTEVETAAALDMIVGGKIEVLNLVTDRYDLSEVAEAFGEAVKGEGHLKTLVSATS